VSNQQIDQVRMSSLSKGVYPSPNNEQAKTTKLTRMPPTITT